MFKGMFDLKSKKKSQPVIKSETAMGEVTPVLSAETLLSTDKRIAVLNDIRDLLSLPEEEYNRVFLAVIHHFAEFVQNLPETKRSYFSSLGGMLEHALERTALSLFLCRTYLLPDNVTLESISEEEMLWVYAVFTASLFLDIGKVVTKHIVTLTDENGNALRHWLPYTGTMKGQSSHYQFGFNEENFEHIRHLITPLLARQILSACEKEGESNTGFNWLASDPDVLEAWLGMLSDESRGVGSILTVVPLADAQLLESYFTDKKIFRQALPPQTIALLHKLKKDKKTMAETLKKLKESMLADDAARAQDKQDKTGKEKPAKQSLFGFPITAQDQLSAMQNPLDLSAQAIRAIATRFVNWIQKGIENKSLSVGNSMESAFYFADHKILINQNTLSKFLSDNQSLSIKNVSDLKQALQLSEVLRSQNANEMLHIQKAFADSPKTSVRAMQAMVVHSPDLVFGAGFVEVIQSKMAIQLNAIPAKQVEPAKVQTAQEKYEVDQQKVERQQQMRPTGKT